MPKINKIITNIGIFAISFISMLAHATDAASTMLLNSASTIATDSANDTLMGIVNMPIRVSGPDKEYVHSWISQLFGNFVFLPWNPNITDNGATLLAHAIGFTNILAFILGLVITYYVMIGGVLHTAHSGEVLGKKWSSYWIPVRSVLGYGFIMPITSVGGGIFSFAQMFILWLIILGSNAATVLWEQSINLLLSPEAPKINLQVGAKPTHDLLSMIVCTDHYIRADLKGKGDSVSNIGKEHLQLINIHGMNNYTPFNRSFYASKTEDTVDTFAFIDNDRFESELSDPNITQINFGPGGNCGSIYFNKAGEDRNNLQDGYKEDVMKKASVGSRKVIAKTIDKMINLALQFSSGDASTEAMVADLTNKEKTSLVDKYNELSNQYYLISSNYAKDITHSIYDNIINNADLQTKWKGQIAKGGWAGAGQWFYELNAIPEMAQAAFDSISIHSENPSICSSDVLPWFFGDSCKSSKEDYANSLSIAARFNRDAIKAAIDNNNTTLISPLDKALSSCIPGESCTADVSQVKTYTVSLAQYIIDALADGSPLRHPNGINNPFQTVTSIGQTLNNAAKFVYILGSLLSGSFAAASAANHSIVGEAAGLVTLGSSTMLGAFLIAVGKWYLSGITILAMQLLVSGFILAYFLPFLPIITWIIQVVGYLITIVESLIASPLAIVLMLTPEGEGISGTRLERAMQLIAMAILKPSLMVIGLISAISISCVAFGILNEFFFTVASNILAGGIVDTLAIIVLYTTTCFQMCKLLISLMYRLPTQILEWFSSGVGRSFGESDIGHAVEGGANQAKGFVNGVAPKMAATLANDYQNFRNQKDDGSGGERKQIPPRGGKSSK